MRIAIVTYNWPPRNAIGTHRPYSWASRWSAQGHEIHVITAKKYPFDEPLDLRLPKLQGVEVHEVPFLPPVAPLGRVLAALKRSSLVRRLRSAIRKRSSGSIDVRSLWPSSAMGVARDLSGRVDVVVSTFGPDGSHIIASGMKRESPGLRWVADFRDLWSENPLLLNGGNRSALARLEKDVILSADALTTVSDELADVLREIHNKKTVVIANGFDMPTKGLRGLFERPPQPRAGRPLSIVYTGTLYPGRQDPTPLLVAIDALVADKKIKSRDICVQFYGSRLKPLSHADLRRDFVQNHGHVSRDVALARQRDADLLLLMEAPGAQGRGIVTGKLFEYLASGVPILSIGSDADSAIGRVLAETGCGRCFQDDVAAISSTLLDMWHGVRPDWYAPDLGAIARYSRTHKADEMMGLISSLFLTGVE